MAGYDDMGREWGVKFGMFMAAVASERALAAAAGLPPGSVKQQSRAAQYQMSMRMMFAKDTIELHNRLFDDNDRGTLAKRALARYGMTSVKLDAISREIVNQSMKQAKFGLDSPLDALSKRRSAGAVGLLAQKRLAEPSFKVRDSAGHTWDAEKLVQTLVRDMAYQNSIDSEFNDAVMDGVTEVEVVHPEVDHPSVRTVIPLDDKWLSVRDKLFHVNSSMTISYGTL